MTEIRKINSYIEKTVLKTGAKYLIKYPANTTRECIIKEISLQFGDVYVLIDIYSTAKSAKVVRRKDGTMVKGYLGTYEIHPRRLFGYDLVK
jgi:hypothetical protein